MDAIPNQILPWSWCDCDDTRIPLRPRCDRFLHGVERILVSVYLAWPICESAVLIGLYSIIQRVGVMPMSIAGIAKEVSTITLSAWYFGDRLTPLNMTGVGITVCGMVTHSFRTTGQVLTVVFHTGIGLFTYHKYHKSMESPVPLDTHGNPITDSDEYLDGADAEETAHLTAIPRSEELDEVRMDAVETDQP